MRRAICTIVMICGFVLPVQARSSGPAAQHVRQVPVYCGWIGVRVRPITRRFAENLGMVEPTVQSLTGPNRVVPPLRLEIEAGDVITAINGTPLARARDFATIISNRAPPSRDSSHHISQR